MLEATTQIIPLFLGGIFGFGVGYAIRDIQQVRKEQKELEKQTHYFIHDARDHLNCRCSLEYLEEEEDEEWGDYDD
ncbi:MAG: hypothetical protein Q4P11_00260 [Methanobrevibacter sp.]|nr:hypothetical protein [Methanobrevibacter sp.]